MLQRLLIGPIWGCLGAPQYPRPARPPPALPAIWDAAREGRHSTAMTVDDSHRFMNVPGGLGACQCLRVNSGGDGLGPSLSSPEPQARRHSAGQLCSVCSFCVGNDIAPEALSAKSPLDQGLQLDSTRSSLWTKSALGSLTLLAYQFSHSSRPESHPVLAAGISSRHLQPVPFCLHSE